MSERASRILVVDDERDICRALRFILIGEGYEVDTASGGEEAMGLMRQKDYDLLLTDLKMDGMNGEELLTRVRESYPSVVPVMMTAYATVENAVRAMKLGAADYIIKPFVNDDVVRSVGRLLEQKRLRIENLQLKDQLLELAGRDFIGESSAMREIFATLRKVVETRSNILLLGESGTGKGRLAEIIHYNSLRSSRRLVSLNCSAIPATLIESELFGYVKGAFTGADRDKQGLMAAADGGTLFLDEIAEMPVGLQTKLLRAIESQEILPVGSTEPVKVDLRLIAATNRDPEGEIQAGRFREDLYYRLNVIEITLPPLRERGEDIRLLASHLIDKFARIHAKRVIGSEDGAIEALMRYPWPGNVRELSNVIERAVLLTTEERIGPGDLPSKILSGAAGNASANATLKEMLNYFERQAIEERLVRFKGNKEDAARDLGIDLATLYRKMKKLGL